MKHVWPELPDTRTRLTAVLLKQWDVARTEFSLEILRVFFAYQLRIVPQSFNDLKLRSGFSGILSDIIRFGQESGEIKKDLQIESVAGILDWIQLSTLIHWTVDPDKFPITERLNLSVDLLLDGIQTKRSEI